MLHYFWSRFFGSVLNAFAIALIISQITIAPIVFADPPPSESNQPPRPPIEVVVGDVPGLPVIPETKEPALEKLQYEIDHNMIHGADPEALHGQGVSFKFGAVNYTFDRERLDIPPVSVKNFVDEVNVSWDDVHERLNFDFGHWQDFKFVPKGITHFHEGLRVEGTPAVDPQFVAVATVNWTPNAEGNEVRYHRIRMMSVTEFAGDGDSVPASGFVRDVSFYPTSVVKLPEGATIQKLEFYSPYSKPRAFEIGDPVERKGPAKVGDLLVDYSLADGTKRTSWISRETLMDHLEVSLQYSIVWRAVRFPTPANLALARDVLKHQPEFYERAFKEASQERDVANSSDLVDWAVTSKLGEGSQNWVQTMLSRKDEPEARSIIAQVAQAPRQELPADPAPDSTWSRYHEILKAEAEKDSTFHEGTATHTWGNVLLKHLAEQEKKSRTLWQKNVRRLIALKNGLLTPTGTLIWGTALLTTMATMNPDSDPAQYIGALGSRLYDWASGDGLLNSVVKVGTDMTMGISGFVGKNMNTPHGFENMASVAGSLFFWIAILPVTYYLLQLTDLRKFARDFKDLNFNRMVREGFTKFCKAMSILVYPVQKIVWEQILNQKNLYLLLRTNRDPFKYGEAWNSPIASRESIEEKRKKLELRLRRETLLKEAASRVMALAICEKHFGLNMATLEMGVQSKDIPQMLQLLATDPKLQLHWAVLSQSFYNSLRHLAKDDVELNPNQVLEYVAFYRNTAIKTNHHINNTSGPIRRSLSRLAQAVKSGTSKHIIHWGLFGRAGLEESYQNWNMYLNRDQADRARNMIIPDYISSQMALTAADMDAWRWGASYWWLAGEPRIAASSGEQIGGWNVNAPNDVVANSAKQAHEMNPYRPIAGMQMDKEYGGPVEHESLEASIAAIFKGLVNPETGTPDGDKVGILSSWRNYLTKTYRILQGRLAIAGIPMAIGFSLMKTEEWAEKMSYAPGWVQSTPTYIQVPIIALFTSAWYHLVKHQWGNYAMVWPVVVPLSRWIRNGPNENLERLKETAEKMVMSDPRHFREGVQEAKSYFAKAHRRIPEHLNKPTGDYTHEEAQELRLYMQSGNLPFSTESSFFLDVAVLNFGIGAIGSSALYNELAKTGLFAVTTDPVSMAVEVATRFALYLGALHGANWVLNRAVWPHLESRPFGLPSIRQSVNWTVDGVSAIKRGCKEALGSLIGKGPQRINLE